MICNEIKKFICYALLAFLAACTNTSNENDNLPMIDIAANLGKMEARNLSEFTDSIKYVTLETKNDILFSNTSDLDISSENILITDMNVCLLFDTHGNFISKIGTRGRGPGEYSTVAKINLGANGKIYLSDMDDLYEYNTNGSLIRKYVKCIWNENYSTPSWFPINDSLFFGHVPNSTGRVKYRAILFDKSGEILHSYKNYLLFNMEGEIWDSWENDAYIYKYKNTIFYRGIYDDTLFYLTDNHELAPECTFNLGKYKQPVTELEKKWRDINKYIFLNHVFQTKYYLLLDCYFGDYFPARRLTPRNHPSQNSILYNTRSVLGIFNKKTGKLSFCKPTSTDNPLFTSGLRNDIDGGPRFYPDKMVNDSTMVMWIDAKQLKDHVASDDFKNNVPKFPEKKKELEELANKLTIYDNPILMFVTFKR